MSSNNNYGLFGQLKKGREEEYDDFLCLSKKCKQRKRERHKARMAKRNAKTDARKAETERVRAETQMMQQVASISNDPPPITMPLTRQHFIPPKSLPVIQEAENENPESGVVSNTIIVVIGVVGVLLIGGYLYQMSKKTQLLSKTKGASTAI